MPPKSKSTQDNPWSLMDDQGHPELRRAGDKPGAGVCADWRSIRLPDGANSLRRQPLGRAVGGSIRTAVDATAGLGYDTFALALMGIEVLALERNADVFVLLKAEWARVKLDDRFSAAAMRIHIEHANARDRLPTLRAEVGGDARASGARGWTAPDLILLDPMYGGDRSSAKSSKEIQALSAVVGLDEDSDDLLDLAIAAATKRVIVKRARLAKPLAGRAPDWTIRGKLLRFDVYRAGSI